ncbi:MAG: GNAT family N-acetyltransferase [Vitreoscilla sp.]|nr:GNAT family N-acetyltransferase [Vitreoscilla sp.]
MDAEAIEGVRVAAWRAAYREYMPASFLDALDPSGNVPGLQDAIRTQQLPFELKILENDGMVVASMLLGSPRYPSKPSTLELWALNVAPGHWRCGAGRMLVQEALVSAKAQAFSRVELLCLVGNKPAVALYESCGFIATGEFRTTTRLTGHPLHEAAFQRAP